jgi:hypothetical protein
MSALVSVGDGDRYVINTQRYPVMCLIAVSQAGGQDVHDKVSDQFDDLRIGSGKMCLG